MMTSGQQPPPEACKECHAQRFKTGCSGPEEETVALIAEEPLAIVLPGAGTYRLMATPLDLEALAAGLALTEGIISGPEALGEILIERTGGGPIQVRLEPKGESSAAALGEGIVGSSGGVSRRDLGRGRVGLQVGDSLRAIRADLAALAVRMREGQTLFQRTGGSHAAVLFEGSGVWRGLAEDIGRHNALDKVLGLLLLEGRSPRGLGAVLSGRVSGEMVAKAVQAGLEILAAVSAPSAMAVEVAAASGLTLCAFVRENRMTVFTHPYRIRDLR